MPDETLIVLTEQAQEIGKLEAETEQQEELLEEIGEKVGFDIEYRYTGVNDPNNSSFACVTQFVGIYGDWSKLDRDMETLIAAGIGRHLFKMLTSNDDIDLKPVTEYLKAV